MANKNNEPNLFEQPKQPEPTPAEAIVSLAKFVENPDNPSTVSDDAFDRLIGKLRRVPAGLTAQRIAYVVRGHDEPFVVLSGNKRLRALKRIYGTEGMVPADWFQDISSMTDEQRREFIVTANVNEGKWVADMLLAIMPKDELRELMSDQDVASILAEIPSVQKVAENHELEAGDFSDMMKLKLNLSKDDAELADKVLGDDRAVAFMKIVRGES